MTQKSIIQAYDAVSIGE